MNNEITDTERLNYLEALLQHCHPEISFNLDPDVEDAHGMAPVGFRIRVEGCDVSDVVAPTFRECIDREIRAAQNGEWSAVDAYIGPIAKLRK